MSRERDQISLRLVLAVMFCVLAAGWFWMVNPPTDDSPVAVRVKSAGKPPSTINLSVSDSESTKYASISGRIVFTGEAFPLPLLVRKGDQTAKDWKVCACEDVPDERLVIDPDSGGVRDVFVYLGSGRKRMVSAVHPSIIATPPPVTLLAKHCRFHPHAFVVRTNQTIQFVNSDGLGHNLHVIPVINHPPIVAPPGSDNTSFAFRDSEPVPIEIACDFHSWMMSYVLPLDHPYAAVTGTDGSFRIDKVPAGKTKLYVWHEKRYLFRSELTVPESGFRFGDLKVEFIDGHLELTEPASAKLSDVLASAE